MPETDSLFHLDTDRKLSLRALVASGAARAGANAPAILGEGRPPLSYQRLLEQMDRMGHRLREAGVGRSDRVAVVLPNGPSMAVAFLGLAACCACAPLNPAYRREEFDFYLADLEARAIVLPAGQPSAAREAALARGIAVLDMESAGQAAGAIALSGGSTARAHRVQGAADGTKDVALVLHTSGTTSRPKIVPLTQENLCLSAINVARSLELSPADRCLNVMPLFHIHGLVGVLLSSLSAGASVACSSGFVAPRFFEWVEVFGPTWYSAVPTMHQAILGRAREHPQAARSVGLRLIRSSSSALPPQVMAGLEEAFAAPVIEAYGMTEAAHQMACNPLPPQVRKPGSVGLPAGPEIAILDESGAAVAQGKIGEIAIRGRNVMSGYEKNPTANAAAFTNGWFRTGDQGYLDKEGYLFITGRLKELINRGGEKISPREVDEVLLDHPAVAQALTFAMPDAQLGEEVAAAVVAKAGADVEEMELRQFAAGRLAHFKVPRRIVFLGEIPKGPTGKLQRVGLAAKLGLTGDGPAPAAATAEFVEAATATEATLAAIWREVLRRERIGARDTFLQLGGDSVLAAQATARIRERFGIELTLLAFFEAGTIQKLAMLLDAQEPAGSDQGSVLAEVADLENMSDEEAQRLLEQESAGSAERKAGS